MAKKLDSKKKPSSRKPAAKKPAAMKRAAAKKPAATKKEAVKPKRKSVAQQATPTPAEAPNSGETAFELLVAERIVKEPRLEIGWRIPQTIAEKIHESQAADSAFILLFVIEQETGLVRRLAEPLLTGMAILDYHFDRPGRYTILGTILYGSCLEEKSGDGCFISQRLDISGKKQDDPLVAGGNDDGSRHIDFRLLREVMGYNHVAGNAEISLEISEEFFAPEPPKRLRSWVDEGYPRPSQNACEFRSRALRWAFSVKLLWLVIRSIGYALGAIGSSICAVCVMTIATLLGLRNLQWSSVVHPHRPFEKFGPSIFTTRADGSRQPLAYRLLCPALWLPLLALPIFIWECCPNIKQYIWGEFPSLRPVLLELALFYVTLIWLLAVMSIIAKSVAPSFSSWLDDREYKRDMKRRVRRQAREKRQEEKTRIALTKREQALDLLVGRSDLVKIELVPPERLSWYLRWLNFKTTVCRPFAARK